MGETKQIIILLIVVTLIGIAGLYITGSLPGMESACSLGCGDVYVESYRADLYLNGTLYENFVYEIKESGKYRMLYRIWKLPLSQERLGSPYIATISISPPPGTISYTKNSQGQIKILSETS